MPAPVALLESLPGPWVEEPSGLPPGGPRTWWRGPAGVVIGGPPSRIAAERAGMDRLAGHPALPKMLAASEDGIALAALGEIPEDPAAIVASWPRGEPWRERIDAARALDLLTGRTDAGRGLSRLGVKRRAIDRFLASPLDIASHRGPSLGGVSGDWLRETGTRVVALRWSDANASGLSAADLASTGLALWMAGDPESLDDLRESHREGLPADEADRAFDLALLRRALDEQTLGREDAADTAGEIARAAFARLSLREEAAQVAVRLEGAPDWLDTTAWLRDGDPLPAARARWLLQNLDGLTVGEHRLSVHTDPPLRAGRRPPPREDRGLRRRRLFSRWDLGVQTDDEGLISATPEALASRLVASLSGVVMDGTCGVGSLSVALARNPAVTAVLAVDTHAGRLKMARHNAALYGVESRIRFLHQDVAEALRTHAADALVLDPPWGGRSYDRERVGLDDLGLDLMAVLALAPRRVVLKLPHSFAVSTLSVGGPWRWSGLIDERGKLKFLSAESG